MSLDRISLCARVIVFGALLALFTTATPLFAADGGSTEDPVQGDDARINRWQAGGCGTYEVWKKKVTANPELGANPAAPACGTFGDCDLASVRDVWIPEGEEPFTTIRMVIHILRNDDGSNAICTDGLADAQMVRLNSDYEPLKIRFEYTLDHVNSTEWRYLSESEINAMKVATAIKPDSQLNVWVTYVYFDYSFGTFPWDPDARSATGGIVMGHFHWVGGINSTFAHEVGHCLGLMHTFRGVSEVNECDECYEYVDAPDRNRLGDFCDDTPPGPVHYSCSNTGGTDPCSGLAWGYTMPENYMSYSPDWCYSLFTDQQVGRIRCWINSRLVGWKVGVHFYATDTFGPTPQDVTFNGTATKPVTSWDWDFGDGEHAYIEDPVHTYEQPGYYSVSVTIQTADGPYSDYRAGLVSAYSDTLAIDSVDLVIGGTPFKVDVYADNYIPISEMTIPFTWAGSFPIEYDSFSTVGLRTDYFETKGQLNFDPAGKRSTIFLRSSQTGTSPLLGPGHDPVLSLWFHATGVETGINPVELISYAAWSPEFVAKDGSYAPATVGGAIMNIEQTCCVGTVGNIDCDPTEEVNGIDLSFMLDHLFISLDPVCCEEEANLDFTGAIDGVDLSILLDHLFINLTPLPACQ